MRSPLSGNVRRREQRGQTRSETTPRELKTAARSSLGGGRTGGEFERAACAASLTWQPILVHTYMHGRRSAPYVRDTSRRWATHTRHGVCFSSAEISVSRKCATFVLCIVFAFTYIAFPEFTCQRCTISSTNEFLCNTLSKSRKIN